MTMSNFTMNNSSAPYEDPINEYIPYYTLPSDNSRFVLFSLPFDLGAIDPYFWYIQIGLFSIAFGVLILVHSAFINNRRMHSIRLCSDICAISMILFSVLVFITAYRPNPTKAVVAMDVFGTGIISLVIQLCDAYIFYNRLKAVTNIPTWKKQISYIYIFGIVIFPYYSSYLWLPLFYDMNSDNYVVLIYLIALNAWGFLAFEFYYLGEFIFVLFNMYGGKNDTDGRSSAIKVVIIKSFCHFSTSATANLLYIYWSYFESDALVYSLIYNIAISFGLHFFFNYKIEKVAFFVFNTYSRIHSNLHTHSSLTDSNYNPKYRSSKNYFLSFKNSSTRNKILANK
jgi:hypothetical protein